MLTYDRELITNDQYGGLAQLARAPALHAGGPGFESLILHQRSLESRKRVKKTDDISPDGGVGSKESTLDRDQFMLPLYPSTSIERIKA